MRANFIAAALEYIFGFRFPIGTFKLLSSLVQTLIRFCQGPHSTRSAVLLELATLNFFFHFLGCLGGMFDPCVDNSSYALFCPPSADNIASNACKNQRRPFVLFDSLGFQFVLCD
jgi:hypothetical protein